MAFLGVKQIIYCNIYSHIRAKLYSLQEPYLFSDNDDLSVFIMIQWFSSNFVYVMLYVILCICVLFSAMMFL